MNEKKTFFNPSAHKTSLSCRRTCEVKTPRELGTTEVSAVGQESLTAWRRTWGKGQNTPGPHTQSLQRSRGVNPVSNKLGLTPVIPPAATATEAATHDEMPAPLSHMCRYFDSRRADKHVLSGYRAVHFAASFVHRSLHSSSCACGQPAMLTAVGLLHENPTSSPLQFDHSHHLGNAQRRTKTADEVQTLKWLLRFLSACLHVYVYRLAIWPFSVPTHCQTTKQ